MYRTLIAAAVVFGILASFVVPTTAQAQDFGTLVRSASRANEQLISQIDQALAATDLATTQARASVAAATAQQVATLLQDALTLAPDDASRSRVQGVLTHIQASLAALRLVPQETALGAARGRLNQARGEAEEALSELRPFAQSLPTAAVAAAKLPVAGGLGSRDLIPVVAMGAALALAGLRLRRRTSIAANGLAGPPAQLAPPRRVGLV